MKFTKYLVGLAASAGLLFGCQELEMVQICDPSEVVPPVLADVDDLTITADNQTENAVFTWDAADFGAKVAVNYALEAQLGDGDIYEIVSGLSGTSYKISYEILNQNFYNGLGLPADTPVEIKLYISARVGENEKYYSDPVNVTVQVTSAEKKYPMIYVIGDFNGWADGTTQELFEFTPDTKVYSGMIGFAGKAANGWKVRGSAEGWKDELGNWGLNSADPTPDAEAKEIKMYNNGGSSDIRVYSKNFYHMTFDTNALKLKMNLSFDNIGVVGAFNGWSEVNNVEMQFNTVKQRFYADVEFAEDGEFKFNIDKAWTTSFGVGANGFLTSENGGNIAVKAGNYRVYLNMNNLDEITYELNNSMYGQEEEGMTGGGDTPDTPDTPTPPVMSGWGIVGEITNWGNPTEDNTYISDITLASDGTYLVAKGVQLRGQFKFRKDGDWGTNFGAPGNIEPFELTANTEVALTSGGKNMTIAEGAYDVYFDEANAKAWFINDGSYPGGAVAPEASEWGIVGDINGWGTPDITMYTTETKDLFAAFNVNFKKDGKFKIRANGEWNDAKNYGLAAEGTVEVGKSYDLICGGGSGDMSIKAGIYDIWFDLANKKLYILEPGKTPSIVVPDPSDEVWTLVGAFNGWPEIPDAKYNMTKEGSWYVFKGFTTTGGEMKFYSGGWSVNRGGTFTAVNEAVALTEGGNNINLPAGTYDVYMNAARDQAYFMEPGKSPASDTIKIIYKNPAGWTNVNIYGWGELSFGDWPGKPMVKEGDVWVYELPKDSIGKSVSLIFNNGSAQTVDLGPFVIEGDMTFDSSNAQIK